MASCVFQNKSQIPYNGLYDYQRSGHLATSYINLDIKALYQPFSQPEALVLVLPSLWTSLTVTCFSQPSIPLVSAKRFPLLKEIFLNFLFTSSYSKSSLCYSLKSSAILDQYVKYSAFTSYFYYMLLPILTSMQGLRGQAVFCIQCVLPLTRSSVK